MFDALCCYEENATKVFSILEFKNLSHEQIEKFRYNLTCPVCGGKAYFRRSSKDGKQACFGSRYHDAGCEEFNPSIRKSEEERHIAEVETLLLESDALRIDFSLPISARNTDKKVAGKAKIVKKEVNKVAVNEESLNEGPLKKGPLKIEGELNINKQGLKKLLVSLLRGSSLASSDVWIYTSEKHKWRAKNLFVNVNDAKPTDNGAPRMYWGTISDADKSLNWLNPAEERSVSIPISKYQQEFLTRFDINEARDLEGASFIVFAKCVESKDKKRKFLQLWGNDVQYFYVSKAEE